MVDRESLQEKYAKMDTDDLLEITSNKTDYTELAVSVALEELKKRNVPESEIKSHVSILAYNPDQKTIDNYFVDLNIFQKAVSYFLLVLFYKMIIHRFYRYNAAPNLYEARYVLKTQQANYYMIAGIIFLIIGVVLSNTYKANFLIIWFSGFVISFLFDIGYNKNRQISQIQEKVDQGNDPLEF